MGKDTFNPNKSTSRRSQPYDVTNSFVQKVASGVSTFFGGLFSTPEANSQGTSNGSTHTTSDTSSWTRVGTLDYASRRSNIITTLSKTEQTPGPSRLQTRYELENLKFRCNFVDRGILSTESSGLHKPLNKATDSPIPNSSGLHLSLGKNESPVSREVSNQSKAGPSTFGMKFKSDSSESRVTPRSSATESNQHAKLNPEARKLKESMTVHAEMSTRTLSLDVSAKTKPITNKGVRETTLSIFYREQTTYCSATATRSSSLGTPSTQNQVAVKPVARPQKAINMSHTARGELEEFSTPLNNVKRISTPAPTEFVKAINAPVCTSTFKFGIPKDEPESETESDNSVPMEVDSSPTNNSPESTLVKSSFLPAATTRNTGFTFGNPTTSTTLPSHLGTKYQGFGLNGPFSKNIKNKAFFFGTTTITSATSSNTITKDTVTSKITTEQPTKLPFKFKSEPGKPVPRVFQFGAKTNEDTKISPSTPLIKTDWNLCNLESTPISNSNNTSQTASAISLLSVPTFGTSAQTIGSDFLNSISIPLTTAPKTHTSKAKKRSFSDLRSALKTSKPSFGASSTTFTPSVGTFSTTTTPAPPPPIEINIFSPSAFGTSSPAHGTLNRSPPIQINIFNTPARGTLNRSPPMGINIFGTSAFGTSSPAASMFGSASPQVTAATLGATGTPAFGAASNVTAQTISAPLRSAPEPKRRILKAFRRHKK